MNGRYDLWNGALYTTPAEEQRATKRGRFDISWGLLLQGPAQEIQKPGFSKCYQRKPLGANLGVSLWESLNLRAVRLHRSCTTGS